MQDRPQERLAPRPPPRPTQLLITGQEPLEELRRLIIQYAQHCPAGETCPACPLHILGTLSHASLSTLVNSLPQPACLDLFEMERSCRAQNATSSFPKNPGV